jgi:hypothetical protein
VGCRNAPRRRDSIPATPKHWLKDIERDQLDGVPRGVVDE